MRATEAHPGVVYLAGAGPGNPASAIVGTLGSTALRFAVLTARASSLPSLIGPMLAMIGTQEYCNQLALFFSKSLEAGYVLLVNDD